MAMHSVQCLIFRTGQCQGCSVLIFFVGLPIPGLENLGLRILTLALNWTQLQVQNQMLTIGLLVLYTDLRMTREKF